MAANSEKAASGNAGAAPQYEQQHMTFFQQIAVQANIRYNAGIRFPPTNPNVVASLWYQTVSQHGAHAQVGLARIANQPNRAVPVLLRQPLNLTLGGQKQSIKFAQPIVEPVNGRTLSEIVQDNLYLTTPALPATGPATLFFYLEDNDEGEETPMMAVALVTNVNAGLWDAITIKTLFQAFMKSLHDYHLKQQGKPPLGQSKPTSELYAKLGGWARFLQETIQNTTEPDPKYLPISTDKDAPPAATIETILPKEVNDDTGAATATKDRRVSAEIDGETVAACQQKLESHGATLGGLGAACFTRALAEAYFEQHSDKTHVTLAQASQIDPRQMLPASESKNYIHAVGVLTHGGTISKAELFGDSMDVVEWLCIESKRVETDIQTRLDRGEGIRKTMELATGKVDKALVVQSALEIVDHGIYDTPTPEFEIELGHRFDLCPHMSAVVHIEKATGVMKLEAQIGKEQDRDKTLKLFERCTDLWKLVANQN